ncbi:MAG: hypothetical protein U1F27_06320 [Turneriella sp.]
MGAFFICKALSQPTTKRHKTHHRPVNRRLTAVVSELHHLEIRSLLNGVSNTLGSLNPSSKTVLAVALNLGTGVLFSHLLCVVPVSGFYRSLYWPFVLTMRLFLFFNIIVTGSQGEHYLR